MSQERQIIEALRSAESIAVISGAGVSAESGIPTFRDALSGLWLKFDAEDLATPQAFARNPELVSRWYDERRCNIARCRPNAGHVALARLQQVAAKAGKTFTLITQNVDRLHQAAGSTDVIELHGTLWIWRCVECGEEIEERGPAFAAYPLKCSCGGLRRPAVVWFGEALPQSQWIAAEQAAASCDLFLSLGTSSIVQPAAGLIDRALRSPASVLEVNPQPTPMSGRASWSLRGKSGEILPWLVDSAFGEGLKGRGRIRTDE